METCTLIIYLLTW